MFRRCGDSVLALGVLVGLDPMRLGITLLVISRPLTACKNLLDVQRRLCDSRRAIPYVGDSATKRCCTSRPCSSPPRNQWAKSSTGGYIQIGMGLVALIDGYGADRALLPGAPAKLTVSGFGEWPRSALVIAEAKYFDAQVSRLLARAQDTPAEGGSAVPAVVAARARRVGRQILWVSYVIGFSFAGAPPDVALFLLAIVVVSGAAVGTQITAAIAFVVGMLAVVEIVLVSYLGRTCEEPRPSCNDYTIGRGLHHR